MPPSQLVLPEPAHTLFSRTAALLEARLAGIVPAGGHWWLGGGTVLAAQWHHRISTDIDIFLPADSGLSAIAPNWDRTFTDEMAELGATRVDVQPLSLKFTFPEGRVEITALDPVPSVRGNRTGVEGRDTWVLPNVCILSGKLQGRGMSMPPRDVFDICVAARMDPGSLEGAVNHLHEQTRAEIVAGLLEGLNHFREDAERSILGPLASWQHLLVDGPRIAAEEIRDAVYQEIDLKFEDGQALATVESQGGRQSTLAFRTGESLVQGLLALGLEQWMVAQSGTLNVFTDLATKKIAASLSDDFGNT